MRNIFQPTNGAVRTLTKWFVTAIFLLGQYIEFFALFSHHVEFFGVSICLYKPFLSLTKKGLSSIMLLF